MNQSPGMFIDSQLSGRTNEAVVLLGYSDVVDFVKAEGFRAAVVSEQFSLEDIFKIDYPIQLKPEDETALHKSLVDLSGRHKIRGVVAFDGILVLVAAKLGKLLELKQVPSVDAVNHCIRKDEMRRLLAQHPDLAVPYRVIGNEGEVAEAVNEIGLPCVVKPVDSSNSRHVEFCADQPAAIEAARAIFEWARKTGATQRVLIEPYLEGQEFSVECFTHDGETTVMAVCEKILGPLPYFVEIGHYSPTRQPLEVEHTLAETARRALEVLGIDALVTHIELRRTPEGNKIIEINPRPAGGKLREFIRTITGYDLHEAAVQLALGRRPAARPRRASHGYYHCLTTDVEGIIHYSTRYLRNPLRNGLYPLVELSVHPRERVYPVNHKDGQILGRILAYGDGLDIVNQEIHKVLNELQFQITPTGEDEVTQRPVATADAGQVSFGLPQSYSVPGTPAWVPGFGWVWIPFIGSSAAPAPSMEALQPTPPALPPFEQRSAVESPERETGKRVDAKTAGNGAEIRAETKTIASALGAFRILTRPDNVPDAAGKGGTYCGNNSDNAENGCAGGPEMPAEGGVRTGSGAWDKGCC